MAIKYSATIIDNRLTQVNTALGTNAYIRIYSGTRPATVAASARVIDFARGHTDTVDERDLMDASPAAIRAAIDSGRLD
jgi:hypothetical protein